VTKKTILGYLLLALWLGPFPAAYSLEKVSAVYTSISGGYAPLWVGKEKQAFEQYGLDVRLIYMRGTIPTSAALANGEIEFIPAGALRVSGAASRADLHAG
jgi:ABC-type nitrate/sulfonate/bicarbonate transport system substrate-binding protein